MSDSSRSAAFGLAFMADKIHFELRCWTQFKTKRNCTMVRPQGQGVSSPRRLTKRRTEFPTGQFFHKSDKMKDRIFNRLLLPEVWLDKEPNFQPGQLFHKSDKTQDRICSWSVLPEVWQDKGANFQPVCYSKSLTKWRTEFSDGQFFQKSDNTKDRIFNPAVLPEVWHDTRLNFEPVSSSRSLSR